MHGHTSQPKSTRWDMVETLTILPNLTNWLIVISALVRWHAVSSTFLPPLVLSLSFLCLYFASSRANHYKVLTPILS